MPEPIISKNLLPQADVNTRQLLDSHTLERINHLAKFATLAGSFIGFLMLFWYTIKYQIPLHISTASIGLFLSMAFFGAVFIAIFFLFTTFPLLAYSIFFDSEKLRSMYSVPECCQKPQLFRVATYLIVHLPVAIGLLLILHHDEKPYALWTALVGLLVWVLLQWFSLRLKWSIEGNTHISAARALSSMSKHLICALGQNAVLFLYLGMFYVAIKAFVPEIFLPKWAFYSELAILACAVVLDITIKLIIIKWTEIDKRAALKRYATFVLVVPLLSGLMPNTSEFMGKQSLRALRLGGDIPVKLELESDYEAKAPEWLKADKVDLMLRSATSFYVKVPDKEKVIREIPSHFVDGIIYLKRP